MNRVMNNLTVHLFAMTLAKREDALSRCQFGLSVHSELFLAPSRQLLDSVLGEKILQLGLSEATGKTLFAKHVGNGFGLALL